MDCHCPARLLREHNRQILRVVSHCFLHVLAPRAVLVHLIQRHVYSSLGLACSHSPQIAGFISVQNQQWYPKAWKLLCRVTSNEDATVDDAPLNQDPSEKSRTATRKDLKPIVESVRPVRPCGTRLHRVCVEMWPERYRGLVVDMMYVHVNAAAPSQFPAFSSSSEVCTCSYRGIHLKLLRVRRVWTTKLKSWFLFALCT